MDDLGIEYQTVLGLPPVDFVHLAAELGCRSISMKPRGGGGLYNPYDYPTYSFLEDKPLRRRMAGALAADGVTISLGEGFIVQPGADLRDDRAALEVMAEFGVGRVNVVTLDPDLDRSFAQFAAFAEAAAEYRMETVTEFSGSLTVSDLPTALAAVRAVARPDFTLLIDTMHVARSGATGADLAGLPPASIGYLQLSDSSARQRNTRYRDDSIDRDVPGDGELPLIDLLLALPDAVPVGVEAPMLSRAAAGSTAHECARLAVEGARRVLAEARARRRPSAPADEPIRQAGGVRLKSAVSAPEE